MRTQVQTQRMGKTIDLHGDYLKCHGHADILFPTNFAQTVRLLEAAVEAADSTAAGSLERCSRSKTSAHVELTSTFMQQWHDVDRTTARDGFNPLLEDFTNTSILTTMDANR